MSTVDISTQYVSETIKTWGFQRPLIIGVSGPQGSGKSYVSENLAAQLAAKFPHLNVISFSLDDFYLPNKDQKALATEYQDCGLITEGRGLPGTHSLDLLMKIFAKIKAKSAGYSIPTYDKSKYQGQGDRSDPSEWIKVDKPLDIVIFEGWFVGFKSVETPQKQWEAAISHAENDTVKNMLESIDVKQIVTINSLLSQYEKIWELFDRFIFLCTFNLLNVYTWRQQQEDHLISIKGTGMTKEEVVKFVDRYFPVYKMYYENLREHKLLKQGSLYLEIGLDRRVVKEL